MGGRWGLGVTKGVRGGGFKGVEEGMLSHSSFSNDELTSCLEESWPCSLSSPGAPPAPAIEFLFSTYLQVEGDTDEKYVRFKEII